MSVESSVQEYVDFIQNSAQILRDQSLSYAEIGAQPNTTVGYGSRPAPMINPSFLASNPTLYNPIEDLRGQFDSKYHGLLDNLNSTIPTQFANFMNTYFPKPARFDEVVDFLTNSIFNGSIGLPAEIQQQLWDLARERDMFDAKRQEKEAIEMSASKGFIVSPEVVKYRILTAKNQASQNLSGTNRQIAIDEAKLRIEWVKFAVEQLLNLRAKAIEAALQYIARILANNDASLQYATGYVNSYRTFYESFSAYYDSINKVNQLKFQVDDENAKFQLETAKLNDGFVLADKQRRTNALIDTAKSLGSQAASALSSVNSLVSLNASTVQSI